jgi:stage III sporulation protein AE
MSNNIKLNKFIDFFNSAFKWSIGIIFSIFLGILSIQGVSAGKYDSISIKTTKFAVKSYIPIIGSYISESMDFIVLGSVLIKNAVGVVGVVVLFYTILNPILNILLLKFGLQLSSSILEVSGNDKISNFIQLCSKVLILPIILILGVSIMFIMVLCLIMSTANIF